MNLQLGEFFGRWKRPRIKTALLGDTAIQIGLIQVDPSDIADAVFACQQYTHSGIGRACVFEPAQMCLSQDPPDVRAWSLDDSVTYILISTDCSWRENIKLLRYTAFPNLHGMHHIAGDRTRLAYSKMQDVLDFCDEIEPLQPSISIARSETLQIVLRKSDIEYRDYESLYRRALLLSEAVFGAAGILQAKFLKSRAKWYYDMRALNISPVVLTEL